MRKRQQYQKPKAKSKIPTLIIMCVTLFIILVFGKSLSWKVASIFEPTVPITDMPQTAEDQAVVPISDAPDTTPNQKNNNSSPPPSKAGFVFSQANKNAAKSILNIISKGSNP